jgi:hypothetical protein
MNRDQKRSVMRRFLVSAPPGQTAAVLKALKTVVQDDALFFEVAPTLVCEHHVRHGVPVDCAGRPFTPTRANHVPSWSAALPPSVTEALVNEGLPDTYLAFTFVDWAARTVSVLDPLTAAAVSTVSLSELADEEPVKSLVAFGTGAAAGGLGFTPQALQAAASLALRDAIAAEISKYGARRYGSTGVKWGSAVDLDSDWTQSAHLPTITITLGASRVNDAACWEGRWVTAVTVSFSEESDIAAALFSLSPNGAIAGPRQVKCSGQSRVDFTYYEEGNIQMDTATDLDFDVLAPEGWAGASADDARAMVAYAKQYALTAPDASTLEQDCMKGIRAFARRIVRSLENTEDALQERVAETSRSASLTDSAMKPLRRKLPVTKQLFDFGARNGTASTRKAFAEKVATANVDA